MEFEPLKGINRLSAVLVSDGASEPAAIGAAAAGVGIAAAAAVGASSASD